MTIQVDDKPGKTSKSTLIFFVRLESKRILSTDGFARYSFRVMPIKRDPAVCQTLDYK